MKSLGLKIAALLCAISLWFFVVSAKTYRIELEVPLRTTHLSALLAISSHLPRTIPILIEGTGIDLIRLKHQDSLAWFELDLGKAMLGTQQITLDESLFKTSLRDVKIVSIQGSSNLELSLDTRIVREVPVRLHADLVPAKDYVMVGEPRLIQPTVLISGARNALTRIYEISTASISNHNLKNTDTISIPLTQEGLPADIDLKLIVTVQKRTSRVFTNLPVQLVGPYQRGIHELQPNHVTLEVRGGKDVLEQMDPKEIRLFIEFTRFQIEATDSLVPTVDVASPIESWSMIPSTVRLVTQLPQRPVETEGTTP